MKHTSINIMPAQRQQGAVLIMGLVLLMALTIVGVASMGNNTLQSRMAGNLADSTLAFTAAETAARSYENAIDPNIPPNIKANCQGATYDQTTTVPCVLQKDASRSDVDWMKDTDHTWWTDNSSAGASFINTFLGDYTNSISGNDVVKTAPRVIGELQSHVRFSQVVDSRNLQSGVSYYRITSRGTGSSDNSQAMIQQIVARYK